MRERGNKRSRKGLKKMVKRPEIPDFLEDLGLRILGAVLAVGLMFSLVFIGDFFDIRFLNSQGGLLIGTIVVMEAFFFSAVLYLAVTDGI